MTQSVKAVIFDCDGVLINSEELWIEAEKNVQERHGFSLSDDDRRQMVGLAADRHEARLRDIFRERCGKPLPESYVEEWRQEYRKLEAEKLRRTEGLVACIEALREAGIPYAVASNSEEDHLHFKMKATGIYDLFHPHIYARDHVENPKPAPDLYLLAARKLGVDPRDCAVVEDSPTGMKAGAAAGAHVIAFAGGYRDYPFGPETLRSAGAKERVETMDELKNRVFQLFFRPEPSVSGQNPELKAA